MFKCYKQRLFNIQKIKNDKFVNKKIRDFVENVGFGIFITSHFTHYFSLLHLKYTVITYV
jgi:hypothetical protein